MNDIINEPNGQNLTSIRHDGWTGDAMVRFLETLAETGVVLEACALAGKSRTAAYALRRRHPLFAAAWEASLQLARDRLADELLGRSIEGNVERMMKDGEVVAEKHFLDNRLALAMLKRLDQRADAARHRAAPADAVPAPMWEQALAALHSGEDGVMARALAALQRKEVDEVDDPLFAHDHHDNFAHDRIWRDLGTMEWRTNFPAPLDFTGFEKGGWDSECYSRALTKKEMAALVAAGLVVPEDADTIVSYDEDVEARDAFFASLEAAPLPLSPPPSME